MCSIRGIRCSNAPDIIIFRRRGCYHLRPTCRTRPVCPSPISILDSSIWSLRASILFCITWCLHRRPRLVPPLSTGPRTSKVNHPRLCRGGLRSNRGWYVFSFINLAPQPLQLLVALNRGPYRAVWQFFRGTVSQTVADVWKAAVPHIICLLAWQIGALPSLNNFYLPPSPATECGW